MWIYKKKEFNLNINQYEGFVYLIICQENNKKYIGKKTFWFHRKNKKTRRREKKESDWRNYYGSSDVVKADIKIFGKEKFDRYMLRCCSFSGEMNFFEEYYQHYYGVLFSDEFYNDNIRSKLFKRNVKKYIQENGFPKYLKYKNK